MVMGMTNERLSFLISPGGGADLTPYYLFEEDIRSFHRLYQKLCSAHNLDDDHAGEFSYLAMKHTCDEYFYLPARQEHRGTGGIFFDDMLVSDETLAFCKSLTTTWMPSWLPIVQQRRSMIFTEQQKEWQKLRRGRYLEFNLLYDVRTNQFGTNWNGIEDCHFRFLTPRETVRLWRFVLISTARSQVWAHDTQSKGRRGNGLGATRNFLLLQT